MQISLVVVGLQSGQVYLFDLMTCPAMMNQGLLAGLIESKEILKVCLNMLKIVTCNSIFT